MSNQKQGISDKELEDYDFGDALAPEGYNPEQSLHITIRPGWYPFKVRGFTLYENETGEYTDQALNVKMQYSGTKMKVELECIDPEFSGARANDFIFIPQRDVEFPVFYANRFGNMLRGLGVKAPEGRLIPPGFKLKEIIGLSCGCKIENSDPEKTKGKIYNNVVFFSYVPVAEIEQKRSGETDGKSPTKSSAVTKAATTSTTSKPAAGRGKTVVDIDSL